MDLETRIQKRFVAEVISTEQARMLAESVQQKVVHLSGLIAELIHLGEVSEAVAERLRSSSVDVRNAVDGHGGEKK